MDIKIVYGIEGAKNAKGLAVVIDVFRAFSFECYAINNGADRIIAVGDKEQAYQLKRDNPQYLLAGERGGKILEGFDYGNSPTQIEKEDFTGKTIIHTTSTGTQGIENAKQAKEIITGSLVNARAIANYIIKSKIEDISLIPMGLREAEEDNLCAEYIKALVYNKQIAIEEKVEELKRTSGKKFFEEEKQQVFPRKDFFLCTQLNKFDFVLKVEKSKDGLNSVRKQCK